MTEADDRLRKLAPKIGRKKTRELWLARLNPRTRKYADMFIGRESDRLLGENYEQRKILLPPPTAVQCVGDVQVGRVWYDGARSVLGLNSTELAKHTGVIGASGSGKTTFSFTAVKGLLEAGYPCVVFDPKRTWRSLLECIDDRDVRVYTLARPEVSRYHHNFLIPPAGVPAELFDSIAAKVGDEVLYGGLGSHSIIKEAVTRLRHECPMPESRDNHFTMNDLALEVRRVAGGARSKRMGDWSATAIRVTAELSSPPLGSIINVRRNVLEGDVDRAKLVVFECDLLSQPQYTYLVTSFLLREYFKRLDTDAPDELERVVVFEEAARIFAQPYPQPTFETVLREIREKGVGLFWITQSAGDVNHTAWANTNTLFVFKQISASDISKVGKAVAFERPREAQYCARLETGEAIVRLPDRYHFPFLIRTEDVAKTRVTDERIKALADQHLEALGAPLPRAQEATATPSVRLPARTSTQPAVKPQGAKYAGIPGNRPAKRPGGQPPAVYTKFASKDEEYRACMAQLLAKSVEQPGLPLARLYAQMGISKGKGGRVLERIVREGLAERIELVVDGMRIANLVPTSAGEKFIQDHRSLLGRKLVTWTTHRFGGSKSEELAAFARSHFSDATLLGEEVSDGFGGKWDMLWEREGEQFVVELATGESKRHEALHAQKALSAGLPIVYVVPDETIAARISRYLDELDIEVDGERVQLVVCDQTQIESAERTN